MVERAIANMADVASRFAEHIQMAVLLTLYATVTVAWLWFLMQAAVWLFVAPTTVPD